ANTEREDQTLERDGAADLYARDEIADAGFAVTLLRPKRVQFFGVAGEAEDVGGFPDPAAFVEGGQLLLAQALDVEGASRDEMLQPLDDLGVADQPAGAAAADLVARPHRLGAADRAVGGKDVGRRFGGSALRHDRDDL